MSKTTVIAVVSAVTAIVAAGAILRKRFPKEAPAQEDPNLSEEEILDAVKRGAARARANHQNAN